MRYDVKKFLFMGLEEDRAVFFKLAQEVGVVHFIDSKPSSHKSPPQHVQDVIKAIKVLRGLPPVEQEEVDAFDNAPVITKKILSLKETYDKGAEKERICRFEMHRVHPFGDFSLDDIVYIEKEAHRKLKFYCAKQGLAATLNLPDEVLTVAQENGLDYLVAIQEDSTRYPKLIEMTIEKPWGILNREYQELKEQMHVTDNELKELAKYNDYLHHFLINQLNDYHLQEAKDFVQNPLEPGMLFTVEGWVPTHKLDALETIVTKMPVHVEEIATDDKDTSPTCLENTGAALIGEDLVHIYDTPSNTDKDPSVWVLVFFALFFSMIIGDGGYGLIMLLVALYIRNKKTKLTKVGKRALDLVTILSFSVIAWGVLTTSFFGITIAPNSQIQKISPMSWLVEKKVEFHIQQQDETYQEWVTLFPKLKTVSDPTEFLMKAETKGDTGLVSYDVYDKSADNILMELALFFGVLHIILSMLRYIKRNPQNIGWVIFLVGAYLYTPVFLGASSILNFVFGIDKDAVAQDALYMMYGGFSIAVVIALFKYKWLGLIEATVVIQIFGDVLSYLRLYALGLSGSLLTATMNEMAAGAPIFFAILILIFGHTVNIVLSIMGGVIHGLRLNFLEWYHYSFEGGGKPFNPLRKLEIE